MAKRRHGLCKRISVGSVIGEFTVVEQIDGHTFKVNCSCGNSVVKDATDLLRSRTGRCKKCHIVTQTKPLRDTPEYQIWHGMKQRCHNLRDTQYQSYGGRGIVVCDQWRHSFDSFISDMGLRPSPNHSIDRINNDGNYEKSNCRWATAKEQAHNKPYTRLSDEDVLYIIKEYKLRKNAAELAKRFGVKRDYLTRLATGKVKRISLSELAGE